MTDETKATLERDGRWERPSEFADEDYPITMRRIEESQDHHLLDTPPIPVDGPVRILTGAEDELVPVAHVLETAAALRSRDVVTEIVKAGSHRLSSEAGLVRLCVRAEELSQKFSDTR